MKERSILQIYYYFFTLSLNNATLAPQNSVALMIMQHKQRQILVTSALHYANGPIHIGHMGSLS